MDINIKYIASNTSLMMSLSVGYPQILASGYPDSKFAIRFSPISEVNNVLVTPVGTNLIMEVFSTMSIIRRIFYSSVSWGPPYLCHSVGTEFTKFIVARVGKWNDVP